MKRLQRLLKSNRLRVNGLSVISCKIQKSGHFNFRLIQVSNLFEQSDYHLIYIDFDIQTIIVHRHLIDTLIDAHLLTETVDFATPFLDVLTFTEIFFELLRHFVQNLAFCVFLPFWA